jgi:GT2 family glycosyltransferase
VTSVNKHLGVHRSGIVVPTLGDRPEYLKECIDSIRSNGDANIIVVRPLTRSQIDINLVGIVDEIVDDPVGGLAAAINFGIIHLPPEITFCSWIGDDDRLTNNSLRKSSQILHDSDEVVCVYGQCQYIGPFGENIWLNRSGKWAVPLMRIGPQLVPQPGSLFRRASFVKVGQLDETLKWAFDLDLFLKLRREGCFRFLAEPVANFRWHPGSLTVGSRGGSVREASCVRKSHLPYVISRISFLWEPIMRKIILRAGGHISSKM